MAFWSAAPASLPPGLRIYAIGDVHGCLDRLEALHAQIADDLRTRPPRRSLLIHLGDYVDRGTDSAGVIARLAGTLPFAVSGRIDLLGNHESFMLQALRDRSPRDMALWLDNGGDATLASYKLNPADTPAAWRAAIPERDRLWLLQRPLMHREAGYVFVHAGIRPGVALADQAEHDLLWIREPFLSTTEPHQKVVVHGHTPARAPQVLPNRIGIDTGAVMGGALTCLVLQADRLRFLVA